MSAPSTMDSFTRVIELWDQQSDLAADLKVKPHRVRAMKSRDSIPDYYWVSLVKGAARRNIDGVTLERLAALAAGKRKAAA